MLGLYLHVPFCQAICSYCNFNRGLLDGPLKARYVDTLAQEIAQAGDRRAADTIFFGGGTPSLLEPDEIARLIEGCRAAYALTSDAEITLETNPETVTVARLEAFRRAGVNRISFGVQSFDDDELRRLERVHSADRAAAAVGEARAAGFTNLSFDLMLWLPGQTLASWLRTVEKAISLAPDHLSMYLLELYPNSPLKEAMARAGAIHSRTPQSRSADWAQLADDEAADMYLQGMRSLEEAAFAQYEISNLARPGFASRHNLKYWEAGDWYGFGCGAHSTVNGERWQNVSGTVEYIDRIGSQRPVSIERRTLSAQERIEEAVFTGLRLTSGIDRGNFQSRFGVDPWTSYGDLLVPYVEAGLVWQSSNRFGLTREGMLVSSDILAQIV